MQVTDNYDLSLNFLLCNPWPISQATDPTDKMLLSRELYCAIDLIGIDLVNRVIHPSNNCSLVFCSCNENERITKINLRQISVYDFI